MLNFNACKTSHDVRAMIKTNPIYKLKTLEISPYHSALCNGASVKYFDVYSQQELQERAKNDPNLTENHVKGIPFIHYVDKFANLKSIPETFEFICSSHVIEHTPDIVQHLLDVYDLLDVNGKYLFFMPDKRYCFDHYIPQKSIADVIEAHMQKRKKHTFKSLLEQRLLISHNSPERHWNNDHSYDVKVDRININDLFELSKGDYIDLHAWQMHDNDFKKIFDQLKDLNLIPNTFQLEKEWKTERNSNEFAILLCKVGNK